MSLKLGNMYHDIDYNYKHSGLSICIFHLVISTQYAHTAISTQVVGKVHTTIPKGIMGGFEFTVLQRNLTEWHKRPWTCVCWC